MSPAPSTLVASLVVAGSFLAGCSPGPQTTHGPTPAAGGMSKDAAVARALEAVPATGQARVVVSASIESDPFAPRGTAPPGPLRWVIRLQVGLVASPCPSRMLDRVPTASDLACLDPDGGIDVVLDYYSGELVGWLH